MDVIRDLYETPDGWRGTDNPHVHQANVDIKTHRASYARESGPSDFTRYFCAPLNSEARAERRQEVLRRRPSNLAEYKEAFSYLLDDTKRSVNRDHVKQQTRLKRFLEERDIAAELERDFIDISFSIGSECFIGEIKVTKWFGPAPAFRIALGQLLDYAYRFETRPHMLMLLDEEPGGRRTALATSLSVSVVVWNGESYRLLNPQVAKILASVFADTATHD